jgi:hypothetical protein
MKKDEIDLLQGSNIIRLLLEKGYELKTLYEEFSGKVEDIKKYTFEQFCKAEVLVKSRLFTANQSTRYLVPYIDMANHSQTKNTKWSFNQTKNGFVLESVQDIKKGEEISITYGNNIDNENMFLQYGFLLENNEANSTRL